MCINVHKMSILFLYFVLGLVTFDSLHIVFAILDSIRTSFRKLYPNFLMMIFPWFHFPLLRITLVGSIYMVISVSVERYLAVCFPHNYHRMNSQAFRFLYYIIPAAAAAIFVNVPKFFETQNDYRQVQLQQYVLFRFWIFLSLDHRWVKSTLLCELVSFFTHTLYDF